MNPKPLAAVGFAQASSYMVRKDLDQAMRRVTFWAVPMGN